MKALGNIDTLYFQMEAENYIAVFGELLKEMAKEKKRRFLTGDRKPLFFSLGGLSLEFTNGRFSWFCGLKCEDFHLFFLNPDVECNNMAMYVEFSQRFLWLYGYKKAYERFMDWLQGEVGLKGISTKISRADICVHTDAPVLQEEYLRYLYYDPRCEFVGTDAKEFTVADLDAINGGRVEIFNRARQGYTGIRVGKGSPLMARIYNKSLEIKSSNKDWFVPLWQSEGLNPEKVVNIEYEIKRPWFDSRDINAVEEFFAKVGDIWQFLTRSYMSFRKEDNVRDRRRSFCDWWEELRQQPFCYNGSDLARRKSQELNLVRCADGALGYLVSYAAGCGFSSLGYDVLNSLHREILRRNLRYLKENKPTFEERIEQKRARGFQEITDFDNIFLDRRLGQGRSSLKSCRAYR